MTPGDATSQAASATPDARGQGPAGLNSAAERKKRETERMERKREADRLRAAAKRAGVKPSPVAAEQSRDEPLPAPGRSDDQRAADGAMFLRALYGVADIVAGFFGYEVSPLTDNEARQDAPYLVPLARRYAWFDLTITWAAAPFALASRFKSHLRRKVVATPPEKKEGGDVVSMADRKEKAS